MAAALGDLIRIIDNQNYISQDMMNVYYYRVTSPTGFTNDGYESILDWFETNILAPVADIQVEQLNHTTLQLVNMTNGIDIVERVENVTGTLTPTTGQLLPSFMSIGFKLIRESLVTRNGYKRYGGLEETAVDGNLITLSTTLTDAIADGLKADVVVGLATLVEPVIVKRPLGSPPVASYLYSSIGDAVVASAPGTQNTRKP